METLSFDAVPKMILDVRSTQDKILKLLLEQSELQPADEWMDIDEYIEYNPEHPAKATVYGQVSHGKLPNYKRGRKLFFKKSEIDEYLAQGRRRTRAEIEAEVLGEQS